MNFNQHKMVITDRQDEPEELYYATPFSYIKISREPFFKVRISICTPDMLPPYADYYGTTNNF